MNEGHDDERLGRELAESIGPPDFEHLTMWVITEKPSDFPNSYVAREWKVTGKGGATAMTHRFVVSPRIEPLRIALFRLGKFNIGRKPQDEPQIREVWV